MTIELQNICKRFGETRALDRVSLRISGPKIYGLLGGNGAFFTWQIGLLGSIMFYRLNKLPRFVFSVAYVVVYVIVARTLLAGTQVKE